MRIHASLLLSASSAALLAGCAAGGDSAGGGGNVGFGGAQDIGVFRSILETGGIPGPNTLDANGFFAEHYVSLPPADCGQPLCLQSMLAVGRSWVDDSPQTTLAVALNTPEPAEPVAPRPLDLVVVVDTSGSMIEDDRIGYVKQGLNLLIDELGPEDRMALVTYDTDVDLRADFRPLDGTDPADENALAEWRAGMHAIATQLQANGSTNIYGGLQLGFDLAEDARAAHPERAQRVILLSDGQPTAGITEPALIVAMAEERITSGVGLTTIGVGQDFNLPLMTDLAERGAGNFYYLEDPSAIQEVFTEELAYFVEPLALDVTIEVRAADGHRIGEVIGTRLWRAEGSVGSMHVPALFRASRTDDEPGEGGGRRGGGGTLFIEMQPIDGLAAGDVAEVRMRYRPVDGVEYVEQSIPVRHPADPAVSPEDAYYSHEAMAKQYAMYNIYLGLRAAAGDAEVSYYNCALARLAKLDERAATWNLELADDDIAADRELTQMFMSNLRAWGATDVPEGQSCEAYYYPEYPSDDDYYNEGPYGCSAGGNGTGAGVVMMLLCAAALVRAGRRRAC
jgi:Ca-activated chloride channel family protein